MFSSNKNRRRQSRGWLSPLYGFMDSIGEFWHRLRHFTARLFDFRWLSMRLSGTISYIWWAIRYPFFVIGSLLKYIWSVLVAWWQIRNFRYLIQGLPALVAIIFVMVVTAYTLLRSDDGLQEMYLRQASDARMRADRQRARLCLERLMQLQYVGDPRRQETQFQLGRLAAELNQPQRSKSLLTELANPDNDEGYVEAHLERARAIWQNTRHSKDELVLIEKHLRRAIKKQPEHKEVNAFLGMTMAAMGRTDEAIPFLLKSDPAHVDARLTLAKIYKMQGHQQQANMYIEPLIAYLEKNANGEIDDLRMRLTLANAYMQIDEFENAIKVLETGNKLKPSDFYRAYLSNCYTEWYKKQVPLPLTPDRERTKLDCLVRALEWDNTNVQAMNLFVYYMGNNGGSDAKERDRAHRLLLTMRGNNPYLHMWLGQKLNNEGKVDEARIEWDMAFKLNPNSPILANNFAWILTQGNKNGYPIEPDLLRAEQIINEVIKRSTPEDKNWPNYHGTRGTIYMKMGRFAEARDNLVVATQKPGSENDFPLQRQLIDVYDKLRMPTMAENHRKLLAETIKRNTRAEAGAQ